MRRNTQRKNTQRKAYLFQTKLPLTVESKIHYGQKPMAKWAESLLGPLAAHIPPETAEQYGVLNSQDWYDLALESLASKLDQVQE